jgi:predicted GIY-YIG superfamily endonuclease
MTNWTKEICQSEASKHQTKREFKANNRNAYEYALRHDFLDEICQHMISLGDRKHKCVYSCEFPDNHVYVGITFDFNRRKKDREKKLRDTVTQYSNKTGLQPIHKQLTDYLKTEEAVLLEAEFVKEYENQKWIVLNKIKTGGIGGDILYWTKERCIEEGLKFTRRSDFNLHSKGAYDSCRRNGWLNEIYSHMKPFNRIDLNLYWIKERCITKALLCNTRTEFRKKYAGAYLSARRHKWLDEICQHMITKKGSV